MSRITFIAHACETCGDTVGTSWPLVVVFVTAFVVLGWITRIALRN